MTTPLYVLIAASGQPVLLRRTLCSLAACTHPPGYRGVIVIENGPRSGLDSVVQEFAQAAAARYLYSPPPNNSQAHNKALQQVGDALCEFTDDDVQFTAGTLSAYAAAAADRAAGEFYGGPIIPDYEAAQPPDWLQRYLPRSAAGWKLEASSAHEIHQAEFIGPNFAAFAVDLRHIGGFDTNLGPGRHMVSPGEDTEIQERLLQNGVRGYYLPDASMHHLVRAANVTQEFAIHRAERNGLYWGIRESRRAGFFPRRWLKACGQWLNDRWRIRRWQASADEQVRFRAAFVEARWRGRWRGMQLGPSVSNPSSRARSAA
jgi:GT2 family glycosyltransferase